MSSSGCLRKGSEHLVALERDLMPLIAVKKPFHRISYDEAVEKLQGRRFADRMGHGPGW